MHVLLLTGALEIGGADQFAVDLLTQLRLRGHRAIVVVTLPGAHPWQARFAAAADTVVLLHQILPPADHPAYIASLVRSKQVDLVLVHQSEAGFALLPYLRHHCPAVACTAYVHMVEPDWRAGGYPALAIQQMEQLDAIGCTSAHLRGWLMAHGAPANRTTTCYIGVDPAIWQPDHPQRLAVRAEFGIAPDVPVIIVIGRLVAQKRPLLAAAILQDLTRAQRFVALFVGDGPERGRLQRAVQGAPGDMRVLGAVPNARVAALLAASDLLLLPSQDEGIALVLFQALAAGVVPVAAAVGGQAELVTADCGILVPQSGDEQAAYVAALRQLLDDPQQRTARAAMAMTRVRAEFDLNTMGGTMHGVLSAAVTHAAHTPLPRPDAAAAHTSAAAMLAGAREEAAAARLWGTPGVYGGTDQKLWARAVRCAKRVLQPAYREVAARMPGIVRLVRFVRRGLWGN